MHLYLGKPKKMASLDATHDAQLPQTAETNPVGQNSIVNQQNSSNASGSVVTFEAEIPGIGRLFEN